VEGVVKGNGIGTNHHSVASWFVERAELDCLLIAGEYSLLGAPAAEALFPLCRERSVAVLVAGVYKSGILADPRPGIHVDYRPAEPEIIARVNQMRVVCERHGVPLAAVALQFVAAHPAVDAVVVGAATAEEAGSNVDYLSLPVPPELFAELAEHELLPPQGRAF
jgi:D-threo-aldose 1-dehydrogenase